MTENRNNYTVNTKSNLKEKKISTRLIVLISLIVATLILIMYGISYNNRQYEEKYKNNLAAKTCTIYNNTTAVIDLIENSSSLEWYLDFTDKPLEEALKTYGSACHSALKENHGLSDNEIEPEEYNGKDNNIREACEKYNELYNKYNEFVELIVNPYIPPEEFLEDVYSRANYITDLYVDISTYYSGNIETDHAINNVYYGLYYRNKNK